MGPSNHKGEWLSQNVCLNTFMKYTYLEDAGLKTEPVFFFFYTIYIIIFYFLQK